MKFRQRFGVHLKNKEQFAVNLGLVVLMNVGDILFGGAVSILTFILTVLVQSILSHSLLSLVFAGEGATEKVKFFKKEGR